MIRRLFALLFLLSVPVPLFAQTGTVTLTQPDAPSAAEAQAQYTFKIYVTPAGSNIQGAPVTLTGVTCTGTSPLVTCTAPLPTAAAGALTPGSRTAATASISINGVLTEGPQSVPFGQGPGAPTAVKVSKS